MGFLQGADYLALPHHGGNWLIQDVIPVGGLAALYGQAKIGKSFAALQIAEAIASGKPHFLGLPIQIHGPVAYMQIDTPRSVWLERAQRMEREKGYDFSNVFFADNLSGTPYPFNIITDWQWLKAQLDAIAQKTGTWPVLTFMDTLREMFRGDENDSAVMQNVFSATKQALGGSAGCFVAHAKKPMFGQGDSLMSDVRGSSYIPGAVDCMISATPKRLTLQSRAMEEMTIPCERDDIGLWMFDADEERAIALMQNIVNDDPGGSESSWARELVKRDPTKFEGSKNAENSARNHFRRKKKVLKFPKIKA